MKGKVIAIRREDQSVWERRAPLAPVNVRRLVRAGVKVIVQPSNRRAYPIQVVNPLCKFFVSFILGIYVLNIYKLILII